MEELAEAIGVKVSNIVYAVVSPMHLGCCQTRSTIMTATTFLTLTKRKRTKNR